MNFSLLDYVISNFIFSITKLKLLFLYHTGQRSPWSSSHGRWINNYLLYQCLSPLKLWVRIPLMARWTWHIIIKFDKVCRWLTAGQWFSLGTPVSATNKTDRHDITEILLKVAFNTITQTPNLENVLEICDYHKRNTIYSWRIL